MFGCDEHFYASDVARSSMGSMSVLRNVSWSAQTDYKNRLRFRTLLIDGLREVRFERTTMG